MIIDQTSFFTPDLIDHALINNDKVSETDKFKLLRNIEQRSALTFYWYPIYKNYLHTFAPTDYKINIYTINIDDVFQGKARDALDYFNSFESNERAKDNRFEFDKTLQTIKHHPKTPLKDDCVNLAYSITKTQNIYDENADETYSAIEEYGCNNLKHAQSILKEWDLNDTITGSLHNMGMITMLPDFIIRDLLV